MRRKVEGKRGGEGKKMWVGGELWKDWERASAAFASSPFFSIKYGSQKHIPAAELSQKKVCVRRWDVRGWARSTQTKKRGEDRRWEDGSWRWDDEVRKGVKLKYFTHRVCQGFSKGKCWWYFYTQGHYNIVIKQHIHSFISQVQVIQLRRLCRIAQTFKTTRDKISWISLAS